jgi:uncharacterized protein (DUF885 family)
VAAGAAAAATAELGAFLDRELMPLAREKDACGPEVYAWASRNFLGAAVDLREAYAWSWEEIARLRAEMARVSGIRVNAVSPANIQTPMHAPETYDELARTIPLGRVG